jgi:tripartite-type tricarboxylate transporter receptor subunit TctC
MIIVGRSSMPAHDLKSLIAWLKENPGAASQGTAGVGSIGHVAGLMFQKETGTRYQLVPYRGAAPAMQDLVAGQIDLAINVPVTSIPQVRGGLIKPYAVAAKSRLPIAPDIPTVDEAGLPGFYLSLWLGLWAPKGTPTSSIARLNEAVATAMDTPATREKLTAQGFEIWPRESQTPEALAAFQKAEIERWWPIIKAANITGE